MANDGPAAKTDISADGTLEMPAADRGRDPDLPHSFGRFLIDSRLGQGGMGIVFAGRDADLGRPVAIKVLRPELGHLRERLLREARAMARVEHPNVVRVYEVGTDAANVFVAMELIEGTTLDEWLRLPRGWEEVVAMFRQVGEGLRAVHRAELVHRDFKPQNVLVDRAGVARVADFGLVRHESDDASPLGATLTQTGAMMGTPGYMAPEQQFGGDVDARADQYSFCVALREALGGRPFDEARWRLVPATVRDAIGRGLAFDAADRWPSLDDMLATFTAIAPDTTVAMPTARRLRPRRRGGVVIAVAAVGVVALAATVFAVATRGSTTPDSPPVAPAVAAITPTHDGGVAPVPVVPPVDAGAAVDAGAGAVQPAAQLHDRARLALIRKTVHDLGYDGIDVTQLGALRHRLDQKLATSQGIEAAIARVQLGMMLRRQGDCSGADAAWQKAIPGLVHNPATKTWVGRAHTGLALCALERGDMGAADDEAQAGWGLGDSEDPELHLISAIATYELDGKGHASSFVEDIMTSDRFPMVKKLMKQWLAGVGWKWDDEMAEVGEKVSRADAAAKAAATAAAGANTDAGVAHDAAAGEMPFAVAPLPPPVPRVIPPKLPAATVGDPGHLPVLRSTIRDLGYIGVNLAATDKDPEASQGDAEQRVASLPAGMPQASAKYDLAMIMRRRGDCAHALATWTDALQVFDHDKLGKALAARSRFGIALCDLADGNGYAAKDMLARAWLDGDQLQIKFAMALAAYERGERPVAQAMMIAAEHEGGMNVEAALKTWLAGTGLTLMP